MFRTIIPRNVRLAEAPSFGKPALHHDKDSRGALAYLALAGELIRRDEEQQQQPPPDEPTAAEPPPAEPAAAEQAPYGDEVTRLSECEFGCRSRPTSAPEPS